MRLCKLVFLVLLSSLIACGGGGGGGSSDPNNDEFGLRIIHASIQTTPLEYANPDDETMPIRTSFLGEAFYKTFPEGPVEFGVFTANSGLSDLTNSIRFDLANRTRYSVLIFDTPGTVFSRVVVFEDSPPEISAELAQVRIINGVTEASTINVTVTGFTQAASVPLASSSVYQEIGLGLVNYTVNRSSDNLPLTSGSFESEGGKAYSIVVAGEAGIFASSRVFQDN